MNVLIWLSIGLDRRTPSFHLLEEIIKQLYKKKCNITVVQKSSGGDFDYSNLKKYGVKFINVKCRNPKKNNLINRYFTDLLYIFKCKKILKKNFSFDSVFIQSSNVGGFQASIIRNLNKKCNLVYNVQDLFPNNLLYIEKIRKNSIIYKLISFFQFKVYEYSDHIITISEDIKNELMSMGIDEKKITVVYNWSYQDDVYSMDKTKDELVNNIFAKDKFNVVYAGNIGIMQNVDILIDTAKILKNSYNDINFIIIGNGVYKQKLVRLKDKYKLDNVYFYDMFPSDLVPIIYQNADVNVIPLHNNIYKTALPSKTATCLACQKPIIFCIGKNSLFGSRVSEETKCSCIDCNDAQGLADEIIDIKSNNKIVTTKDFFMKYFSKTKNGKIYADIITKSNKKRVLILTTVLAPYRVELFNEISKDKDIELTVCFEQLNDSIRNSKWYNNCTVFRKIFLKKSNKSLKVLKTDFFKILKKREYDLVIFYEPSTLTSILAIRYCIFHKIKYMLNCDGALLKKKEKFLNKFIKTENIKHADGLISNGKSARNYYLHYKANPNKIFNHHFSNLKKFEILNKPLSINKKRKLKEELNLEFDYVFLSVGNFISIKGFNILLDSIKKFNNENKVSKKIGFVFIGSGIEKENYNYYIKENNLSNVIIKDFMLKDDLLKYYDASDCFILLSLGDVWGLVVHEAMSRCLPVISTNRCNAALELIINKNIGAIINLDEHYDCIIENVVNQLNYYLNNEVNSLEILNIAQQYSIEQSAIEHIEIIKKVV